VTLGPATRTEEDLRFLKAKGVAFVRVNMSHSSMEDLHYFIALAKKVGIPFIIDTEGSQIRTGDLSEKEIFLEENASIRLTAENILGNKDVLTLKPSTVVEQLSPGDLVYIDFGTLVLKVSDTTTCSKGYITAKAITAGSVGRNKGVVIDSGSNKIFKLPPLTEKDYQSIALGLKEEIGHVAASFMRSAASVEEVRRASEGRMKIISKIECTDALENLDEIIAATDALLIDRGDLSKEIRIERVPFIQKIIMERAKKQGKPVYVATNLLETMVEKMKPTRAEICDIVNTLLDGASGLCLSAETAIGKFPMETVNVMNKVIRHVESTVKEKALKSIEKLESKLVSSDFLTDFTSSASLIEPHGGMLVNRQLREKPAAAELAKLRIIQLDENLDMDVEQIAIGTFSPIEGFMRKGDVTSVLETMRLKNGTIWPIPLVLDVDEATAESIEIGETLLLKGVDGTDRALLTVSEKYSYDLERFAQKLYGTNSLEHPGVGRVRAMKPIFLAGTIDLIKRRKTPTQEYELTPAQVRRLFEERGWSRVVGFHTRNVIHRSHEFIQLKAMEQAACDGLFVHPVIGKKKVGDFNAPYIIRAYEMMSKYFYPKNKAVFAAFSTFSRYAGPKEAIFTALCRKNFGCSHFIVGRDHTGVGTFYAPTASHEIFDQFPDLGIIPVRFNQVFYSEKLQSHIHEAEDVLHAEDEKLHISGTQARQMLEKGELPPEWFMRPEIAQMIVDALNEGAEVFVKE
jgi:pyruvate kinase